MSLQAHQWCCNSPGDEIAGPQRWTLDEGKMHPLHCKLTTTELHLPAPQAEYLKFRILHCPGLFEELLFKAENIQGQHYFWQYFISVNKRSRRRTKTILFKIGKQVGLLYVDVVGKGDPHLNLNEYPSSVSFTQLTAFGWCTSSSPATSHKL